MIYKQPKQRKKKMPVQWTIRTSLIDEEGHNRIITKSNDKVIHLSLKLQSENRARLIGTITKSTKTIRIRRNRTQHLFRKANAYGFNEYVLKNAKQFDTIWLSDEHEDWKIPVSFIVDNGIYLNFKQQGFELQKFVSLESIEEYRVKPKENRRF